MGILLITGPPASGKNTIAEQLGKTTKGCAVIDVENIRDMVVTPTPEPWNGDDYREHLNLSVVNACALANNFHGAGLDVVIVDVLTAETVDVYRAALASLEPFTLLLLPSADEIASRLLSRPDYLSRGDFDLAYRQQADFEDYDARLDNSDMSPEDVVVWILQRWPHATE